jgi:Xaa-Pro aminopeptidase
MEKVIKRIANLREAMRKAGVSACIIPGTDPHASEYIAECWKDRVWISGFTGSAGTAVVALEKAGLWTDSRYFLQGTAQLEGTGMDLMKLGQPETPDITNWLIATLKPGENVAVNAQMYSVNAYAALKADLQKAGIGLVSIDVVSEVWTDRPLMPLTPCFLFDVKYAGQSAADKLTAVRSEMKKLGATSIVLSMLDEIAWLFNIRGNDVNYNPVVISYAMVEMTKATLFIAPEKISKETTDSLLKEGVVVVPYSQVSDSIRALPASDKIMFDGSKLNQALFEAFPAGCGTCNTLSPVAKLKSIKNEVEIAGYRRAMVKDGVALTKFFKWLEENVHTRKLTEITIDERLTEFRAEQKDFMGPSFNSIASYAAHGAIVHYSATEESAATLLPEGIFLLDSGGQYLDGTTDTTRTISLGKVTKQQCSDFSLVLKGNIALSNAVFPVNTRGCQLDILARKAMWESGINYGHGTGHGVGHFLNVHEGPQSIRAEENPVVIEAGMCMSNEPAMYRTGEYGIRTENMLVIVPAFETEYGKFLKCETITLCYIDRELFDINVLDSSDLQWIDDYHHWVFNSLSPYLNKEEKAWLANKCRPTDDLFF